MRIAKARPRRANLLYTRAEELAHQSHDSGLLSGTTRAIEEQMREIIRGSLRWQQRWWLALAGKRKNYNILIIIIIIIQRLETHEGLEGGGKLSVIIELIERGWAVLVYEQHDCREAIVRTYVCYWK